MTVVTRFAPSPTGFLHIGGARTALFNWLYARHCGGRFRLRVEDTDRARSTDAATAAILDGLRWLGLDWDDDVVYQSANADRHAAVVRQLLDAGAAYHCYCTPEELEAMRAEARAAGRPVAYDRRWRSRDPAEAPPGIPPVVRVKMPLDGETVIDDAVQGPVTVANDHLDDLILLRADGTPTYMLSVVVDDHDMAVSHVVRGDDHLRNAFRQFHIYRACGWQPPVFAHIPLIHGPDGAKLSKRHGALGVEAYRDMGYLPAALRNYLARLGWSHGDDEIFSTDQAVAWFDLPGVNKAPARIDFAKLANVNGHYLRATAAEDLLPLVTPRVTEALGPLDDPAQTRLSAAMPALRDRAATIVELADSALPYAGSVPLPFTDKATALLTADAKALLGRLATTLDALTDWQPDTLETTVRAFAQTEGEKLGAVAQPLRAALTGTTVSPGIFDVLVILGRDETLTRLAAV